MALRHRIRNAVLHCGTVKGFREDGVFPGSVLKAGELKDFGGKKSFPASKKACFFSRKKLI
jgi:hypothetical protein